jgi:DNA-binding transcriptional MerR regulator
MKMLEQEAKNHAVEACSGVFPKTFTQLESIDHSYLDFIAGANSKYVQIEKIKAQIELLESLPKNDDDNVLWHIAMKQVKLEQQLKQLEDENDTIQT